MGRMENTIMRLTDKKLLTKGFVLAAGLTATLLLSACARSTGSGTAGAGSAGGSNASGTVNAPAGNAGQGENAGQNDSAGQGSGNTAGQAAGTGEAASVGENGGFGNDGAPSLSPELNQDANSGQEVGAEDTYDAANQAGDAPVDTAALADDGWNGTFAGSAGETLTINVDGDSSLSFSFAVSGISGSADYAGDEATFAGDDGNVVIFENLGGSVEVSVVDESGAQQPSAISGSYLRQ